MEKERKWRRKGVGNGKKEGVKCRITPHVVGGT